LQIAKASGATVIATSSSDSKLDIARSLGAVHTINYNTYPEWHEEVLKITDGRGVDTVIDVAGADTLVKAVKAVRIGGLVSIVGASGFGGKGVPLGEFLHGFSGTTIILRKVAVGSRMQ
jgi:NADPH:quinone reductase-like Zn-dependent oxidoreductase